MTPRRRRVAGAGVGAERCLRVRLLPPLLFVVFVLVLLVSGDLPIGGCTVVDTGDEVAAAAAAAAGAVGGFAVLIN